MSSRHRLHIHTQGFDDEAERTDQLQALLASFLGTDFIVAQAQAAKGQSSARLAITSAHGLERPGMHCT